MLSANKARLLLNKVPLLHGKGILLLGRGMLLLGRGILLLGRGMLLKKDSLSQKARSLPSIPHEAPYLLGFLKIHPSLHLSHISPVISHGPIAGICVLSPLSGLLCCVNLCRGLTPPSVICSTFGAFLPDTYICS